MIDFSQNYICKYDNEIQSAHFGASTKQISLHTGAFYYRDKLTGKIVCNSFCTLSECLRHDAAAVWAHLEPILKLITNTVPNISTIHFQSDGPCTQYKNKTNFYLFTHHCEKLNLNYGTWNFTAPGHGKSTADGIGGTVKGLCDRAVAQGKDVTNAESMINIINSTASQKIRAFLVLESDIARMDLNVKSQIKAVPNTTKVFQIVWSNNNNKTLYLNHLSCSYCVFNGVYNHHMCCHFPLKQNKWSFEDKNAVTSKKIKNKTLKN